MVQVILCCIGTRAGRRLVIVDCSRSCSTFVLLSHLPLSHGVIQAQVPPLHSIFHLVIFSTKTILPLALGSRIATVTGFASIRSTVNSPQSSFVLTRSLRTQTPHPHRHHLLPLLPPLLLLLTTSTTPTLSAQTISPTMLRAWQALDRAMKRCSSSPPCRVAPLFTFGTNVCHLLTPMHRHATRLHSLPRIITPMFESTFLGGRCGKS
mmetsp:Transcript_3406/g.11172  ORF Transcript_3406/g.11172 Transcript_3406/m.11172 type:complete len:208 (-) Transcript_3406:375-998(-)